MKSLDKSVNNLSQRLNKLYPDISSNNDGINYWKGKKIVSIKEWKKISNYTNTFQHGIENNLQTKAALQHFPNDYMRTPFPLGVQENFEEDANKWYSDYIELMEYRRNPHYGRTKCFHCLLSPDMEESALFVEINKVIARALEDGNNYDNSKKDTGNSNNNNNPSSTSSTPAETSIYSCKVLNRYACPYDNKVGKIKVDANFDVDDLFALYNLAFQVELAFATAYSMSKSNETIHEADFEAGKVKEISANYHGDPYSFSTEYPLEEKLGEVKRLSKVLIRNIHDVYNALTDRETLNKVLEQGLDEDYQQYKDQLTDFFMSIKDKVRAEDLIVYEPIWALKREKGKCHICQEFANIHCINCSNNNSVWLCVYHWKQHIKDKHTNNTFISDL